LVRTPQCLEEFALVEDYADIRDSRIAFFLRVLDLGGRDRHSAIIPVQA
jgi:hypothetical protein